MPFSSSIPWKHELEPARSMVERQVERISRREATPELPPKILEPAPPKILSLYPLYGIEFLWENRHIILYPALNKVLLSVLTSLGISLVVLFVVFPIALNVLLILLPWVIAIFPAVIWALLVGLLLIRCLLHNAYKEAEQQLLRTFPPKVVWAVKKSQIPWYFDLPVTFVLSTIPVIGVPLTIYVRGLQKSNLFVKARNLAKDAKPIKVPVTPRLSKLVSFGEGGDRPLTPLHRPLEPCSCHTPTTGPRIIHYRTVTPRTRRVTTPRSTVLAETTVRPVQEKKERPIQKIIHKIEHHHDATPSEQFEEPQFQLGFGSKDKFRDRVMQVVRLQIVGTVFAATELIPGVGILVAWVEIVTRALYVQNSLLE